MMTYLPQLVNLLLIAAFIVDRIFRMRSITEYKDAKEAQIENLKQQLATERDNNDIQLTELHKKRYESLKIILDEKESEINRNRDVLTELQKAIRDRTEKEQLIEVLIKELNRLALKKKALETDKKVLLQRYQPIPRIRERVQ